MSIRIALTGGIACGKSLVAKFLNELGVETIDADDVVHELLPDPAERKRIAAEVFADPEKRKALEAKLHPLVKERIEEFFDSSIRRFVDCGTPKENSPIRDSSATVAALHRLALQSSRCSADTSAPHCAARIGGEGTNTIDESTNRRIEKSKNSPNTIANRRIDESKNIKLAIIPLLFETHWDSDYDIICAVISSRETQVERMMTTRGYTREEAEARLAAQMPVTEKAAKSHYVIHNDGTPEELRKEVESFVKWTREKVRGPRSKVRGPRSKVQGLRSKVQGLRAKVKG